MIDAVPLDPLAEIHFNKSSVPLRIEGNYFPSNPPAATAHIEMDPETAIRITGNVHQRRAFDKQSWWERIKNRLSIWWQMYLWGTITRGGGKG